MKGLQSELPRSRPRWPGLLAAAWLLSGLAAAPSYAQVVVMPVQHLRIGTLQSDGAAAVSPLDGTSRLEFDLVGGGDVTLVIELPTSLKGEGGHDLPLRFGPRDGRVTFPRSSLVIEFDPTIPLSFRIPAESGGARVFIGGAALAMRAQAPGTYSGSVRVQVLTAANGGT